MKTSPAITWLRATDKPVLFSNQMEGLVAIQHERPALFPPATAMTEPAPHCCPRLLRLNRELEWSFNR
jgi:hypothetical protein